MQTIICFKLVNHLKKKIASSFNLCFFLQCGDFNPHKCICTT